MYPKYPKPYTQIPKPYIYIYIYVFIHPLRQLNLGSVTATQFRGMAQDPQVSVTPQGGLGFAQRLGFSHSPGFIDRVKFGSAWKFGGAGW